MYSADRPMTSSGVCIQESSVREMSTPTTVRTAPPITATGMAVCTALLQRSSSWAPRDTATVTPTPTESPINRLMMRLMMAPVAPTAAMLRRPQ